MHQVQTLNYLKLLEIGVSFFFVLISILGFVHFVLMVSFRRGFYVFKRLFVMNPMRI